MSQNKFYVVTWHNVHFYPFFFPYTSFDAITNVLRDNKNVIVFRHSTLLRIHVILLSHRDTQTTEKSISFNKITYVINIFVYYIC